MRSGSSPDRNLSKQGTVGPGAPVAASISLQPNEQILQGEYRLKYSAKMAAEIEELFNAGAVESVPFHTVSGTSAEDGYYQLQNTKVKPLDPRGSDLSHEFDGILARVGSKRTHWRAVTTRITDVKNDFGTNDTAYIGVPSVASKVRWFNPTSKAREVPTVVATRNAELGDIDIVDANASSYRNPTLLYEVDYSKEYEVDCRVWDDRGLSSRTDASGHLQWQKVFDVAHQFEGKAIAANGLFRITFDESTPSITAEEWDDVNSTWSSVSLGASDWDLWDVDLHRIGLSRIEAQVEFEDSTTSPNSYYRLDMVLHRGYNWPQWLRPADETNATPSGLVTKLDPIANDDQLNPQEVKTVVDRGDVRG